MQALYCAVLAYLIGTVSPSYVIGKAHGFDIRSRGSGNAGASNVIITLGKLPGAIIAFLDIFKAVLAVTICSRLFSGFIYARELSGVSCILGHIFPFYMNFRGGKGLACFGGVILANDLRVFFIMFAIALIMSFITDYICFVPIIGSLVYPILYGTISKNWGAAGIYCILPLVMCYKHLENLRRIKNGTEARFSFLWNKNDEIDRLKHNSGKD